MTPELTTLAVLCILFVATLSRFTLGFGDALVGMPLLLLILSKDAASPLIALVILTVAGIMLATEWRNVHFQSAWRLVVPGLAGIYFGLNFLQHANEQLVNGVLGVVVILFAAYSLIGPRQFELKSENSAIVFGFLAGLLGGAYNTHAPPLVIYGTLRRWRVERFRATLQGYFLPAGVVVVAGHGWAGRFNNDAVIRYYLLSLPVIGITWFIGKRLNGRFEPESFMRLVNWVLIAVGAALLVKGVF
jgi:uncharacterized membrane protein YfcA